MSTDVTEPVRMVFTRPIHFYTYLDLKREIKKRQDHKHLDNCNILKKYTGIEIGYISETRPNPGK